MPFRMRCECGQLLEVPDEAAGRTVQCPTCGRTFTIAPPAGTGGGAGSGEAGAPRCNRCGAPVPPGAGSCPTCGFPLSAAPPPAPPSSGGSADRDGALAALIPYRNVPALVGYYLAVFSLIPCLGLLLGLAAVVLGIIGLIRVRERPEARGKVHAWVAVLLGGACAVGNIVLIALAGSMLGRM